jgi:MFS superfamily sulfate permease-like transporter
MLSLLSSLFALISGGDLFFVIVERFFIVFAVSAFLIWVALTTINSVIIGAAKESVENLIKDDRTDNTLSDSAIAMANTLKQAQEDAAKGINLDLTSEPQEDMLFTDGAQDESTPPGIAEFEPFKPKRIDTDKDNVAQ